MCPVDIGPPLNMFSVTALSVVVDHILSRRSVDKDISEVSDSQLQSLKQ